MKKILLFCGLNLALSGLAVAQFVTGQSGINIKAGTTFSIMGLTLAPSSDLQINNTTVQVSTNPVVSQSGQSIAKVYNVNPAINFSGAVGIRYTAADLNGNSENLLAIAFNSGSGNYTSTTSFDSTTGTFYVYAPGLINATMGSITAVDNNVPLPIPFSGFSATAKDCNVELDWNAENVSPTNTSVQHSIDGKYWEQGSGSIQTEDGRFKYVDDRPVNGINFYRLLFSMPGQPELLSNILSVTSTCGSEIGLNVFPNPVNNYLNVEITGSLVMDAKVTLFDFSGKIVKSTQITSPNTIIDLSTLSAGNYVCRFYNGQTNAVVKFVKK